MPPIAASVPDPIAAATFEVGSGSATANFVNQPAVAKRPDPTTAAILRSTKVAKKIFNSCLTPSFGYHKFHSQSNIQNLEIPNSLPICVLVNPACSRNSLKLMSYFSILL